MNRHRVDHAGDRWAQDIQGIDLVENGFFIFLKVTIVGKWNPLEHREDTREISDEAPRRAQLRDIGILFLMSMIEIPS